MSYALGANVMTQEAGATLVLLDTAQGQYFELNETGRIWLQALISAQSEAQALEAVCDEFEVDPATAAADCGDIKAALQEAGLLLIS
ncbi:MAG: PqqD family peptide modification chaperone [Pseudomonadota bacterium]